MRSRDPAFRTLPSRTVATLSWRPSIRTSCSLRLRANVDVRDATRSPSTRASAVISSSVMPSLKYSFSGSALRFTNGSTAIDFRGGAPGDAGVGRSAGSGWLPGGGAASASASANCATVAKRSAGARASARRTARSTASGTGSRTVRRRGAGSGGFRGGVGGGGEAREGRGGEGGGGGRGEGGDRGGRGAL